MSQRKGLMDMLTFETENLPDAPVEKFTGTRFQLFKQVFMGRLGMMVKINLLAILFALPIIVAIGFFTILKMADGAYVPFNANLGIGYPIFTNAIDVSNYNIFVFNMQLYMILIPAIIILSIGLAGTFSVMRQFTTTENTKIIKPFFVGIKKYFLPFLFASVFISISLVLVLFSITAYPQLSLPIAVKILIIIASIILCLLVYSMAMFFMSQAVTYKFKLSNLIKNSFLFAIKLFPTNLLILIISAAPIVLVLTLSQIDFINVIVMMLFVFFGLSFIVCIWTIYSNWAFDLFFTIKTEKTIKKKIRNTESYNQDGLEEVLTISDVEVEPAAMPKKVAQPAAMPNKIAEAAAVPKKIVEPIAMPKKIIDNSQAINSVSNKKTSVKFNKKK